MAVIAATVYGGPTSTENVGEYRKVTDLEGKRRRSYNKTVKARKRFNKGKFIHPKD
jgi:hypothetical protein